MKTLREELTEIILEVALAHHDDISMADEDNASEAARAVIEKIVEMLLEKKEIPKGGFSGMGSCCEYSEIDGWNRYHDTLKDLLTEGEAGKHERK